VILGWSCSVRGVEIKFMTSEFGITILYCRKIALVKYNSFHQHFFRC